MPTEHLFIMCLMRLYSYHHDLVSSALVAAPFLATELLIKHDEQSERCCGQKCRAGENRSQISRMASWPHRHSCSGGKQSGSGWAGKQVGEGEEGNGTLHILLICDLFPPALQFLSTAALTLFWNILIRT